MTRAGASAPGKALLCGEYAVLERAPAVVAAVDRRVSATWTEAPVCMPPEAEATLELAREELGPVEGMLRLDASDLRSDGTKLGLGSSAAGTAAVAGAAFAAHGLDPSLSENLPRVFDIAFRGHASIAPRGSGVDVAASVFGGFLRFERSEDSPSIRALSAPVDLAIRLVWTGQAARTSRLVDQVRALHRNAPARYGQCMNRLAELASRFADELDAGDASAIVALAAEYGAAMGALGAAAGVPIVDARLHRAAELAARFSGSAKPCGAGGGDVAIAFFDDTDAANRFELASKDEGLHPIDVSWGARGVHAL